MFSWKFYICSDFNFWRVVGKCTRILFKNLSAWTLRYHQEFVSETNGTSSKTLTWNRSNSRLSNMSLINIAESDEARTILLNHPRIFVCSVCVWIPFDFDRFDTHAHTTGPSSIDAISNVINIETLRNWKQNSCDCKNSYDESTYRLIILIYVL